MGQLSFQCAKCAGHALEEVLINVVQSTSFEKVEILDGLIEPVYLNTSTDGGEIDRYQCLQCGEVLKNEKGKAIRNPESLRDWLQAQGAKPEG